MKTLILAVLATTLFISNAQAGVLTFTCDFPTIVSSRAALQSQDFGFVIRIDTVTYEALLLGNNGHAELINASTTDEQVVFIEITPSGSVQTTAILRKSNKAIHSRHTVTTGLDGDRRFIESQNHGTCVPS